VAWQAFGKPLQKLKSFTSLEENSVYETCLLCGGSGRDEHKDPCNDCDGLGKFNVDDQTSTHTHDEQAAGPIVTKSSFPAEQCQ
jgi:DnaJ-class molecular chaperone